MARTVISLSRTTTMANSDGVCRASFLMNHVWYDITGLQVQSRSSVRRWMHVNFEDPKMKEQRPISQQVNIKKENVR